MRNGSYLACIQRIDYLRNASHFNNTEYKEKFEISQRTVVRDYELMRCLGYELVKICGNRNEKHYYRFEKVI